MLNVPKMGCWMLQLYLISRDEQIDDASYLFRLQKIDAVNQRVEDAIKQDKASSRQQTHTLSLPLGHFMHVYTLYVLYFKLGRLFYREVVIFTYTYE